MLKLPVADRRADLRLRVESIADAERARTLGERLDEAVVDSLGHDDPR